MSTHTLEYDPNLKRKAILTHATVGMNLKEIVLNKISHSQKDKYSVSTYELPRDVNFTKTKW